MLAGHEAAASRPGVYEGRRRGRTGDRQGGRAYSITPRPTASRGQRGMRGGRGALACHPDWPPPSGRGPRLSRRTETASSRSELVSPQITASPSIAPQLNKSIAITLVLILAESHLSIHTWPEENLIAIDLFSCGSIDGEAVIFQLTRSLRLDSVSVRRLSRGPRPDGGAGQP